MSFKYVVKNLEQSSLVILIIITMPLSVLAIILRFIGALRTHRKVGWEDWFAALALIAYLTYTIISVVAISIANGVAAEDLTLDQAIVTSKMAYAAGPFFEINQLFAKASIFALYYRLFWAERKFVVWTTILAVIQICWFIASFFCLIFLCVPVRKWWDILGEVEGWCMNDAALLAAEETINSLIDFAMVGLSVSMILKVQMKSATKRKLAIIFFLGGFSGIIGFVKIGEVYGVDDVNGKTNVSNGFWDILQMFTSIVCCCIPVYKTFLPKNGGWSRLTSRFTGGSSGKTSKTSNPSHSSGSAGPDGNGIPGKSSETWLVEERQQRVGRERDIEMV